ncbi:reductive dehalogenase domain-containing protein [Ancylomarina sp. 16SWW S1-10-2]|uniref:4Fe-4S dicluster domain-containing protein n=1 Tax=Ancylomarina sp. 16SWW S1-10-2 TaxID=2499681 RepID=UPI00189D3C35|nr:reductive dehalogenase domain-containing protein [Ancylomarina sp. 16SWW S1-10-2]MRT93079.1 4Fe-4S dicluster domain-containing protein [Ancylomarina sp. 16SWW S1-10-2]
MAYLFNLSTLFCFICSLAFLVIFLYSTYIFYIENEKKAALIALLISTLLPIPYFVAWYYNYNILALILFADIILTGLLFIYPFKTSDTICDETPLNKVDERDVMFSRNELEVGSENYKTYYKQHPEKKVLDDAFRREAGLGSEKAIFNHTLAFAAAHASFFTVGQFKKVVDGQVNPEKKKISSKDMGIFLKPWAKKLGALDVDFCKLKDYHWYSYKGRGNEYGDIINNPHSYAIAFTVEMTEGMVKAAPQSSIIMESAQQYLDSGRVAIQIAEFLRHLGYSARAHIDGNYQVICPLVARDAGLGEIGRMGLLMTPKQGPRVRVGVVTTDFPLETRDRKKLNYMLDFCLHCKKCAEVCPSKSISLEDPKMIDGVKRWQINSESCFTYWCKAGTDCGRCLATCPFSHPDNLLHNAIRFGIKYSPLFRRIAAPLDNLFYGRKPKPKKLPKWIR